ncbi:MAG: hypothetical protein V4531_01430 [Actinomycetota bacterium]
MTTLTRTVATRAGRHVARRSIRSLICVRSMMMTTVALLVAIGLATVATGGTYALWNRSQPAASNAVIVSGNAELTVTSPLALPTTPMYPGSPTLYGSATLKNTGTIPLTLRIAGLTVPTANAFTQSLKIGFARAADVASCTAGMVTTAWVYSTFASPTVATIGTAVPVGQSPVLCVSVQVSGAPGNTAQGQNALNFVAALDGIQN